MVFWWKAIGHRAVVNEKARQTLEYYIALMDSALEDIDRCELESLDALYGGARESREARYDAEIERGCFDWPEQGQAA